MDDDFVIVEGEDESMFLTSLTIETAQDLSHDSIVKQLGLSGWSEYERIKKLEITTKIGILPDLPHGLVMLECSGNQLTYLPVLPPSLVDLWCHNNLLDQIPDLPPSLVELDCSNQSPGLTHLPDLPSGLVTLWCRNNLLERLDLTDLVSLVELDCSDNRLMFLTGLPPNLISLYCTGNKFVLPLVTIPSDLVDLELEPEHIPNELPETIKNINGSNAKKMLLKQHNRRCNDLGIKCRTGRTLPPLSRRLDIKKQHDAWRFRLDGPEWNEAAKEFI